MNEEYLIHDNELLWYAPPGNLAALATHQTLVRDLSSLILALYAHPRVTLMPVLTREHFHGPTKARTVGEHVPSCEWRRKRSTIWKIAILPGKAIQPWDVLEMDMMSLVLRSRTSSEYYLLLVVDKASSFPFALLRSHQNKSTV